MVLVSFRMDDSKVMDSPSVIFCVSFCPNAIKATKQKAIDRTLFKIVIGYKLIQPKVNKMNRRRTNLLGKKSKLFQSPLTKSRGYSFQLIAK